MTNSRDPPPGWLTISDLARELGRDKSAVSRRVAGLEDRGILATRKHGKAKFVNVAEFDRATAATVDAVRELNGRGPAAADAGGPLLPGDPILAREQARRAAYDADLKQLDLKERLGQLVEADAVRTNLEACALELGRIIDTLPAKTDELAAAHSKDGVTGLRAALRAVSREWRETLARAAERFATGGDLDQDDAAEAPAEEVAA